MPGDTKNTTETAYINLGESTGTVFNVVTEISGGVATDRATA